MGADVHLDNERDVGGEPVADVRVRTSALRGTTIGGDLVPRLIDEIPVLAVAATQAVGTTVVRDAAELRAKESDRVATVVAELRRLGARIEERPDGFVVDGPTPLCGALGESHGDHRIAMALAVAALVAKGETAIEGSEAIDVSYPGFLDVLESLRG
jgi:3-phosphoshikimate 1-carboxyvinyltransferase